MIFPVRRKDVIERRSKDTGVQEGIKDKGVKKRRWMWVRCAAMGIDGPGQDHCSGPASQCHAGNAALKKLGLECRTSEIRCCQRGFAFLKGSPGFVQEPPVHGKHCGSGTQPA